MDYIKIAPEKYKPPLQKNVPNFFPLKTQKSILKKQKIHIKTKTTPNLQNFASQRQNLPRKLLKILSSSSEFSFKDLEKYDDYIRTSVEIFVRSHSLEDLYKFSFMIIF